jgi:hypothetical protein
MNDENLRRRISAIARASLDSDSPRVIVLAHAKKQMKKRRVTPRQMYDVLTKGYVVEHAHRDIKGNWKCTLECRTAGELVKVSAALADSEGESVVVITVMN